MAMKLLHKLALHIPLFQYLETQKQKNNGNTIKTKLATSITASVDAATAAAVAAAARNSIKQNQRNKERIT